MELFWSLIIVLAWLSLTALFYIKRFQIFGLLSKEFLLPTSLLTIFFSGMSLAIVFNSSLSFTEKYYEVKDERDAMETVVTLIEDDNDVKTIVKDKPALKKAIMRVAKNDFKKNKSKLSKKTIEDSLDSVLINQTHMYLSQTSNQAAINYMKELLPLLKELSYSKDGSCWAWLYSEEKTSRSLSKIKKSQKNRLFKASRVVIQQNKKSPTTYPDKQAVSLILDGILKKTKLRMGNDFVLPSAQNTKGEKLNACKTAINFFEEALLLPESSSGTAIRYLLGYQINK